MTQRRVSIVQFLALLQRWDAPPWVHQYARGCSDLGLAFDDSQAERLALRAFNTELQAFVGVLVRTVDSRYQLTARCPKCRNSSPTVCHHALSVVAAFSRRLPYVAQISSAAVDALRAQFLSDPSAGLPPNRRDDPRWRRMADLFNGELPEFREPPPIELSVWLDRVSDAERELDQVESEDEDSPQRTPKIPEDAQLRFLFITSAQGDVHIRSAYQSAEEIHKAPRLIDIDGTDTARRRAIIQRLTQQEMAWLLQIRAWERPPGGAATFRVQAPHEQALLRELIESGRVQLVDDDGHVLSLGAPATLDLSWGIAGEHDLKAALRPNVTPAGDMLRLPELWILDRLAGEVHPLPGVSASLLQALKTAPAVPREHIPRFREALREAGLRVPIPELQDIPDPEVRDADPVGWVVLSKTVGRNRRGEPVPRVTAEIHFRYGPALTNPAEPRRTLFAQHEGGLFRYARKTQRESALVRQLETLGLEPAMPYHPPAKYQQPLWARDVGGQPLSRVAMDLMVSLRSRGFEVELDGDLGVHVLVDAAKATYTDIDDEGGPFIGVDTGVLIDGVRLPLADIAHAALSSADFQVDPAADAIPGESERQLFVALDDTRVVSLPHGRVRELLAPFLEWIHSQKTERGADRPARMKLPRAALLAMAFDPDSDQATWLALPGAEHLRASVQALRDASQREVPVTPDGFVGELREYQREGVRWLNTLAQLGLGGLLGDEMGLGKTVQLLAAILMRRQEHQEAPVLVVAPKQVVDGGWMQKAHFVPDLRILNLTGPDRATRFDQIADADIVLVNYNTMRQDLHILLEQEWSLVVFDESQYMKNMASQTHACARKLQARAKRLMMVSGTPLENHVGELHAQLALSTPGLLGDTKDFNKFYRYPIERRADTDALARLRRRLGPFILRRKKEDVLQELPPKTEILRQVTLSPDQQALYDQHKLAASKKVWEALHTRGLANAQITVLDQLQRLQMICCHPQLNRGAPGKGGSAKVEHILEIVDDVLDRSRRVVIVSQYVSFLKLIGEELAKRKLPYFEIYGSSRDRLEAQNAFQRGERPIMLLSLKAGGVGLDLTAADNVIVASPWWNPQAENQAIDRTHRIGQTAPVFAYRVVCENTIEVEVLSRQAKKLALAASVLDGQDSAGEAVLTLDDVVALFGNDPSGRAQDVDTTTTAATPVPVYPQAEEDLEDVELPVKQTGNGRALAAPPAPAEVAHASDASARTESTSAASPETASAPEGEAPTRQHLVMWMREAISAHGASVTQVASQMGREGHWLYNRLAMTGGSKISPTDLQSLATLCGAKVPAHLQALCERQWSGNQA